MHFSGAVRTIVCVCVYMRLLTLPAGADERNQQAPKATNRPPKDFLFLNTRLAALLAFCPTGRPFGQVCAAPLLGARLGQMKDRFLIIAAEGWRELAATPAPATDCRCPMAAAASSSQLQPISADETNAGRLATNSAGAAITAMKYQLSGKLRAPSRSD